MIRTVCLVVGLFLVKEIHGRDISVALPELASSVEENLEHFNDVLKRDKKSYLSTPIVRDLNYILSI